MRKAALTLGFAVFCFGKAPAAVEWRVEDGGNGHFYEAVHAPGGINWIDASAAVESLAGDWHLVTITSAEENEFVYGLIEGQAQYFNPGYFNTGPWLGAHLGAGGWTWVTGEPFTYAPWGPNQPYNDGDRVSFWGFQPGGGLPYSWDDIQHFAILTGYIIETSPPASTTSAEERAALIALYENTSGDDWTDNTGWRTPPLHPDGFAMPGTECTWRGVGCYPGSTVAEIDLAGNNLVGTLPSGLGGLAGLRILRLNINGLTGGIPSELGQLPSLQQVHLWQNELTGAIPAGLGALTELCCIALAGNELTGGIPPELGGLPNLQILSLQNNRLTGGIPSELGGLTALELLQLEQNQLTGVVPPELGNLVNLQELEIDGNALEGPLPSELLNLTSLQDGASDFCENYLYTDNTALRDFLNLKQEGGDWETCQIFDARFLTLEPETEGRIRFQWADALGEDGYEIYRGTFQSPFFYNHDTALACAVAADTTTWTTVDDQWTGQPSYYYLVVARHGDVHLYGRDSDDVDRPASIGECP